MIIEKAGTHSRNSRTSTHKHTYQLTQKHRSNEKTQPNKLHPQKCTYTYTGKHTRAHRYIFTGTDTDTDTHTRTERERETDIDTDTEFT